MPHYEQDEFRSENRRFQDRNRYREQAQYNRQDDNWAEQVNWEPRRGPYEDYGWESEQSVLPEFRDPSVHLTREERQRANQYREWGGESQRTGRQTPAGPFSGIGPRSYQRSDERIKEDVCERLMQHGQINARDVKVNVQNGEVTLEGGIDNRPMKRMAEDTVMTVRGVKDVHNNLKVSGKQESGMPGGGAGRIDQVGRSGVHPASGPMPRGNAETQGMSSWGQGERGAEGYHDHGDSELNIGKKE